MRRGDGPTYEEFRVLLEQLHALGEEPFLVSYTDPRDGDLLPINNDDNFGRALRSARPLLRVIIQRKGKPAHTRKILECCRVALYLCACFIWLQVHFPVLY